MVKDIGIKRTAKIDATIEVLRSDYTGYCGHCRFLSNCECGLYIDSQIKDEGIKRDENGHLIMFLLKRCDECVRDFGE